MRKFIFRHLRKMAIAGRKIAALCGLSKIYGSVYNFFHGRVYEFLRPKGIIRVSSGAFNFYVSGEDRVMPPDLITFGCWEKEEGEVIDSFLKPGMTFVDIGANFGYFSIRAAHQVGPSGHVYAFEPEPRNFDLLCRNISGNHFEEIVTPVQQAVSEKAGSLEFFLSKFNYGAHSIAQSNIRQGIAGSLKVPCISLDGFFKEFPDKRIDFIKIDTQGAEAGILYGAETTIKKNKQLTILMEFWPLAIQNCGESPMVLLSRLKEWGFRFTMIEDGKLRQSGDFSELIAVADKHTYITLLLEK